MELQIKALDNFLIVHLKGELDHHAAKRIRKKIDSQYYDKNLMNIILDLRELSFMDSSGIGLIIGRYKKCRERQGNVMVVSTNPYIDRMLKISGVLGIVDIYKSIEEAIKIGG